MKKTNKIFFVILFIVMIIIGLKTSSYAGTQKWNSLDYDVTVNSDGSMDVIETWDVFISETNTLFKQFMINVNGNYKITNAKVTEIEREYEVGEEKALRRIYEEQYHVDPECYYALQIEDYTYEIAWHVGMDNSSGNRIFKLYYTVEDAVAIHNDCTELYWQFLSHNNGMSGKNVTGTITLPKLVRDIEKLRVWGHGPLNANITKDSKDRVSISLEKLNAQEMLEIRIVTEENIYDLANNYTYQNKLQEVLNEEQNWAEQANKEREKAKEEWEKIAIIIFIIIVVNIVILTITLIKNNKYKIAGKELKEKYSYPKSELKYFRDIPDEKNATPARALYFYEYKENSSNMSEGFAKAFSATILDLSLKKLLKFEIVNNKSVEISLVKNAENELNLLSEDEKIVYELLKEAIGESKSITPSKFSKYTSKNYEDVYKKVNKIPEIVERDLKELNKISEERKKIKNKWLVKFVVYVFLAFFSFFLVALGIVAIPVSFLILCISCFKNMNYISIFTETGNEEEKRWKALKNYMNDYSMLDEKLVPDIVLWERYLVYATTFGISKKVIEELKVVHPEMFEEQVESNGGFSNYNNSNLAYWDLVRNNSLRTNSFSDFSKGLERVYTSARTAYNNAHSTSSSGSGGGGGFSGGGGGRRWWRKLRRALKSK